MEPHRRAARVDRRGCLNNSKCVPCVLSSLKRAKSALQRSASMSRQYRYVDFLLPSSCLASSSSTVQEHQVSGVGSWWTVIHSVCQAHTLFIPWIFGPHNFKQPSVIQTILALLLPQHLSNHLCHRLIRPRPPSNITNRAPHDAFRGRTIGRTTPRVL